MRLGLERLDDPQHRQDEQRSRTIASSHSPTPEASPTASVDSMTPASLGSLIFARYRTSPAAPTMPKARARLVPTTSITTAPTTARMICV